MDEKKCLLQQIFDNVNSWLHFAEAKNTGLIAFNVALSAAIMDSGFLEDCYRLCIIVIIGLFVSTIFMIWSFKPIDNTISIPIKGNVKVNLMYFTYIATLEKEEYIKLLYAHYWGESDKSIDTISNIELDYCSEIIENSRIIVRKLCYFNIGIKIAIFSVAVFAIGLFIFY